MELWRAVRTFEERVADPILRRLLRSRAHWPFSRWFCLLSFEGAATDGGEDRVDMPVGYSRTGDIVHVVTIRDRTDWWRSFREPGECTIYLGGEAFEATGEVVTNAMKHESHVANFLHPVPALAGPGGEGGLDDIDFTSYVLVEFDLQDGDAAPADPTGIPVEAEQSE